MGILNKLITKSLRHTQSSISNLSHVQLPCVCCNALMHSTKIFLEYSSYDVAACFKCRFYWLDEELANSILPKPTQLPNKVKQKDIALTVLAFENKMLTEETLYQGIFTERLLKFLILLPVNAKKAFVKPLLKVVLFLFRLR